MKRNAVLLSRNILMLYDSSDKAIANTGRYQKNEIVPCNELARECISYIEVNMGCSSIQFETELPDSFSIKTNRLFLTRTIRELLRNAVKYSDGLHISVLLTQTDTTICFTVEDIGSGLPENSKEMIFMPFIKVDDQSEGLGLGLPLCKAHMDGLGGRIFFDENYKEGCRVIIELPKE